MMSFFFFKKKCRGAARPFHAGHRLNLFAIICGGIFNHHRKIESCSSDQISLYFRIRFRLFHIRVRYSQQYCRSGEGKFPVEVFRFTGNQTCPDRGTKWCPVRLVRGGHLFMPRPGHLFVPRGIFLCPGRGTFLFIGRGTFLCIGRVTLL